MGTPHKPGTQSPAPPQTRVPQVSLLRPGIIDQAQQRVPHPWRSLTAPRVGFGTTLLAAIFVVTGCKPVGPNYQRPVYVTPPIYKETGASNVTVKGNHVVNSGDDGVSNNSYLTDSNTVHDITVEANTIMHNAGGRGLEVSGGSNITFTGNYVDNLDGYTDMYIASESEWKTQSVSNITVTGNTFVDGGPNQGTAIVYNSEAGSTTISGVTINGNQFVNPKAGAVQYAGNGSETGLIVENNTDFSTSAFSFSSNPTASPTQSGNTVVAPSTYSTPLVAPGGGCSFAGC